MTMPIAMADSNEDIPTNATNTGVHDTLVNALVQANLVSTLQGDGSIIHIVTFKRGNFNK